MQGRIAAVGLMRRRTLRQSISYTFLTSLEISSPDEQKAKSILLQDFIGTSLSSIAISWMA